MLRLASKRLRDIDLGYWPDKMSRYINEKAKSLHATARRALIRQMHQSVEYVVDHYLNGRYEVIGVNFDFDIEVDRYIIEIPCHILLRRIVGKVPTIRMRMVELSYKKPATQLTKDFMVALSFMGTKARSLEYERFDIDTRRTYMVHRLPYNPDKIRPLIKGVCDSMASGHVYPRPDACESCPFARACEPEFANVRQMHHPARSSTVLRKLLGEENEDRS